MIKNSLKAFLFCTFIFSSTAQAGLMFEPYLGYSFNGSIGESSDDTDYNGLTYGARLGYQSLGLMFGADFSAQSLSVDNDNGADADFDKNQIGIFVGYNAPILFRFWATYFFTGSLEFDGANQELTSGSGFALGAGYTGLPFVSLNLEYRTVNYDEVEFASMTQNADTDAKEILFSVSLPFNL